MHHPHIIHNSLFYLIILNVCTFNAFSQTNIYHPLPDSGYYWNVFDINTECETGGGDTLFNYLETYTIQGDTMVDGLRYLKYYQFIIAGTPLDTFYIINGYLREDSINRKIYTVTDEFLDDFTQDTLLYDFNIEVGASIDSFYEFRYYDPEDPPNSEVIFIDSILIEETYRRRIAIQYLMYQCNGINPIVTDTMYWIEGIGSTIGITVALGFNLGSSPIGGKNAANVLSCVFKGDSMIFEIPAYWYTCDSVIGVWGDVEDMFTSSDITVYPNPADAFCTIQFDRLLHSNSADIYILDFNGRVLYQESTFENMQINTAFLPSGIYVLKFILYDGFEVNKKLIISH